MHCAGRWPDRGEKRSIGIGSRLLRLVAAGVVPTLLAACGAGGGGGGNCSPAPSITSTPPSVANVGAQYRYHVEYRLACIPFVTACGLDFLSGPPDSGLDPIRDAVYWDVTPVDVNKTVQFSIATKRDACGNRAVQTWSVFVPPDTTPPSVLSTSPGDGSVDVPANIREIFAIFNEDIALGSVTSADFVLRVTANGEAVAGTVQQNTRGAFFVPSAALAYSTGYTATVSGAADVEGNTMPAPHVWRFTTSAAPDTTGPVVALRSPESGNTCVPIDALIGVGFDEQVRVDLGAVVLRDSAANAVPALPYWNFSELQTQIYAGPDINLNYGATYTVTVPRSHIRDLAGNAMAADDTWSFTTIPSGGGIGAWSQFSMAGAPPHLGQHTAYWTGTEMIVWDNGSLIGGRYSPTSDTWQPMSNSGAPSPRGAYTGVWTGREVIVWGGHGSSSAEFRNDGGRYDPATDTWTSISTIGAPAGAMSSTAVWTGTEMIVFGGANNTAVSNRNGRYNPRTNSWAPVSSFGAPQIDFLHTAVWTGSRMIVWGGSIGSSCPNDTLCTNSGAAYDPVTNTWSPITTVGAPSPRALHSAIWTGSRMIVWGGRTPPGFTNTGGIYDPATDTWQATSIACGVPSERQQAQAVWTGSEMLIWSGGETFRAKLNGARYNPVTDTWQPISLTNAPTVTSYESMFWIGSAVLLYRSSTRQGFRYQP